MQVASNKVVSIAYTLTDDAGNVLDQAEPTEALQYLHGHGNIVPGLEQALEGKKPSDQFKVRVAPAEGYGERDEELVESVPREHFEGVDEIEVGMQFETGDEEEGWQVVKVVAVTDEEVTVDANHELAGMALNFDVQIIDVRDATEEELAHGHVHGEGWEEEEEWDEEEFEDEEWGEDDEEEDEEA